jgi:hypothetical protein
MTQILRAFQAQGAVGAFRIVKQGTVDTTCAVAAAATDALIGTSDSLAKDDTEIVDVDLRGVSQVVLGGNVARGDPLTSDANGAAIKAAPAAGSNVRIIGFAEVSGVAGDIATYHRSVGFMQG